MVLTAKFLVMVMLGVTVCPLLLVAVAVILLVPSSNGTLLAVKMSPATVAVIPFTVIPISDDVPSIFPVTVVVEAFIVLSSVGVVMKMYTGGSVTVKVVLPLID